MSDIDELENQESDEKPDEAELDLDSEEETTEESEDLKYSESEKED